MPTNGNYIIRITGDVVANHTYGLPRTISDSEGCGQKGQK